MGLEQNDDSDARPIRVFLVEDHPKVRQSLRALLEKETDICVSGEAAELISVVEQVDAVRPDVMLVDLRLGAQDGMALLHYVRERWIGMRTIVVSLREPELYGEATRQAGAWGYVCKDEAVGHLAPAVRAVHQGEHYYSPRAAKAL